MVAVVVFSDDGNAYIMGKDKHSATQCVIAGIEGRKMKYVPEQAQRLQFLERAIALMDGDD
jgi:hypothetical protein